MIITLLVMIVGLLYIIFNLYNQVLSLEESVSRDSNIEERALVFYTTILTILGNTLVELKRVDKRGSFSSDDEVGFVFKTILETIEQTKYQIEVLRGDIESE